MSIHEGGLVCKLKGGPINVYVDDQHPLLILGNTLPWLELFDNILPDLKSSTAKGKWWCGRALKIRIHLGVYILQHLFNKKDRQIEIEVKENAAYQIFCGRHIVEGWHCPDHTKIEEFRSRLTPQTQQILANKIAEIAIRLGFAYADTLDIDSTVQEANIAYPKDTALMIKLAAIAHKVGTYLNKHVFADPLWHVDLKAIKPTARHCFYDKEKPLVDLWALAYQEVTRIKRACELVGKDLPKLPWFIARALRQLQHYGSDYFIGAIPWVLRGEPSKGKVLSFHLKDIACFNKQSKGPQFGRSHQIGRLKGNFLLIGPSHKARMEDQSSLPMMLQLHQGLFGQGTLSSFSADKGYASKANKTLLIEAGVKEIGLQLRTSKGARSPPERELERELQNRRAGVEPLIGHLKRGWQMGKTRMKTDQNCLSSAYTAVLGFNLRQLMRCQS